jgi:O-antigen ligase
VTITGRRVVPKRVLPLVPAAMVVTYAGITILRPALPKNTAFVDPLIFVLSFGGLYRMIKQGSPATVCGAKVLPWLWVILIGSFLGMVGVGMAAWGTTDLLVSYMAFLSLFAFWHLIYLDRLEKYAIIGTEIGMGIVLFGLVFGPTSVRASAYFAQPNYPGHYMVMAAAIVLFSSPRRWVKVLAVVAVLITIWQTGSFGAIAMSLTMIGVLVWRKMTGSSAVLVAAMFAFVVGAIFLGVGPQTPLTGGSFDVSTSLNTTRLNRTSNSRYNIWDQGMTALASHPFGVGPNGVKSRKIALFTNGQPILLHNDALNYLVERGPIGLIGLIGMWVVLWRFAKKRGLVRMLILGILVESVFRETLHYRHLWLFLALAFVLDARRTEVERSEVDAVTEGAAQGAAPSTAV